MPNITVRNVRSHIVEQLKAQAKANHRSLQGEVLHMIENATRISPPTDGIVLARVRAPKKRRRGHQ